MLLCEVLVILLFKPIRSMIQTMVKLAPLPLSTFKVILCILDFFGESFF